MGRTVKYHLNNIHLALEYKLQVINPTSIPIDLHLEPTTLCNLSCPSCPTGDKRNDIKQRADINLIREYFSEYGQYLHQWHMFNWGEATSHPDFADIINLLSEGDYMLHLSSNFSIRLSDDSIKALARSKNLILRIDMDAFSQDALSKYRKGANIDIIKENARRLSSELRKYPNSKKPWLAFLKFPHNQSEEQLVNSFAAELGFGFNSYSPLPTGVPNESTDFANRQMPMGCSWLHSAICISPEGDLLSPCCGSWTRNNAIQVSAFPNAYEAWQNSEKMTARRELSKERSLLNQSEFNGIMNVNSLRSYGLDLYQNENQNDICTTCHLGSAYFQQSSSILALAQKSTSALFGKEKSNKLTKFLISPVFATDDQSVEIMQNLVQSTSPLQSKRPSKRKASDYNLFINFIKNF